MSLSLIEQSLDSDSPVPLYHQLKQLITDSINAGELKPGDSLPSEHSLVETFGISRSTVRRAMADLEHENFIYRQRGRPTLVSAQPVYHGATDVAGFSDDMRSQGCNPWSRVLSVSILCADEDIAEKLQLQVGDEVITAHRLRLADDHPVCIERPYLPLAKVGAFSPKDIEGENSLYQHLREKVGIRPSSVREIVEVVSADEETAELLQIAARGPVVRLQRTVYDESGECMEYAVSLWRTDRFRYIAWRTGTAHLVVRDICSE